MDAELQKDIDALSGEARIQELWKVSYAADGLHRNSEEAARKAALYRRTIARLESLAVVDGPATTEWMRSIFEQVPNRPQWMVSPPNASGRRVTWRADFPHSLYVQYSPLENPHESFGAALLARYDQLTRRHVVDLCAAMGVGMRKEGGE